MGSLGRVRRFVLVGLAAVAVIAVAPAGARLVRATASHCPKGQALLRLGKSSSARGVCLSISRPRAADAWGSVPFLEHLAATLSLGPAASGWISRWVTGTEARSDYARAARTLSQLPDPTPQSLKPRVRPRARPAKVTTFSGSKSYSTPDGWKGTATEAASQIEPDPGAPGEFGYDSEKQVVARNGPATMTVPEHERLLAAVCPSVEGEVPGSYAWSQTRTITIPYGPGTGTIVEHVQIEAKLLAHTTDKGMIRDFDLDMTYQSYAQGVARDNEGHVVQSDDPGLWTIHLSRHGLHLDDPFRQVEDGGTNLGQVVGPGGAWVGGIPTADIGVAQDALRKLGLAAMQSSALLRTLQGAWQDGACIDPNFTSSDLSLSPHLAFNGQPNGGQVATMKARQLAHLVLKITAPYGGKLAPGEYSASVYTAGTGSDEGRLSPKQGNLSGASLPFTYTAPAKGWNKPSAKREISVEITSHQGRGLGDLYISPTPTAHYLKTISVSGSMDYEANYPLNRYQGDTCAVTGDEKYTLAYSGHSATGQPTDGKLDSGGAFVPVSAHLTGTQDYSDPCAFPSTTDDPCHTDLFDDSLLAVWIFHTPGGRTAKIQIPDFGRDAPSDAYCHDRFADDWVQNDDRNLNTQVAWSAVNGTKPFTVSGSDHVVDQNGRSVARQVTITLEPVDKDGRPLS